MQCNSRAGGKSWHKIICHHDHLWSGRILRVYETALDPQNFTHPKQWDWKLEGGVFTPVVTDMNAASDSLMKCT